MNRYLRLFAVLVLACGGLFATAASAGASGPSCTTRVLSVRLADPGPADQKLSGQLCYPPGKRPRAVQLLVHGAAYNHVYWDFPVKNDYYSYVKAAVAAGYATFNVDRIGSGESSHPASSVLTVPAGAVALHDAITALRAGTVDGHAFQKVIWVGHSLGSGYAWYEVIPYQDVDALVLTGFLHGLNPNLVSTFYPATQDPKFAGSGLDSGYYTTLPGTRGASYYYPQTAEPDIIAADEATKDVTTTNPAQPFPNPLQIHVPILLVIGDKDDIACTGVTVYDCSDPNSVLAYESQFYLPETHLQVISVPNTGHNTALSTTAPTTNAATLRWTLTTVRP